MNSPPTWYEPCHEKTNIKYSAKSIDPDQPKHAAQVNPDILFIYCFRITYSTPLSSWDGICQSGLACTDCTGRSGSIHYAEFIMLVYSWNGSIVLLDRYYVTFRKSQLLNCNTDMITSITSVIYITFMLIYAELETTWNLYNWKKFVEQKTVLQK